MVLPILTYSMNRTLVFCHSPFQLFYRPETLQILAFIDFQKFRFENVSESSFSQLAIFVEQVKLLLNWEQNDEISVQTILFEIVH